MAAVVGRSTESLDRNRMVVPMTKVQSASLLMGALAVMTTAVALFLIAIPWLYPTQQAPQLAPSNVSDGVRSAASCEALKAVCSTLAAIHDKQSNYLSAGARLTDRAMRYAVIFVLMWGAISAAGFFYIFAVSRGTLNAKVAV